MRPFCYLLAALVWATIALIVTLAPAAMVVLVLTDQSLVHGIGERFSTVGGAIAMVAVVVPIMALVMGPVIVQLCLAAWPLAALSAIYVARALHPRYARQRLSFTRYATPGHTLGPPTLTGVALSLQPVHATKTTDTLMRMYEVGWSVDWRLLAAMLPAGIAWNTTIATLYPGITIQSRAVLAVLTLACLAWSAHAAHRAWRHHFPTGHEHP